MKMELWNLELWMLNIIKVSILFGTEKTKSDLPIWNSRFSHILSFRLDWSTSDWVLLCTWMIDKVLTVFISVAQRVSSVLGQSVGHMHRPCSQWAPCLQLMPRHKSVEYKKIQKKCKYIHWQLRISTKDKFNLYRVTV